MAATFLSRLIAAALMISTLVPITVFANDSAGFIGKPGEAKRAVDEIMAKIGGTPKIFAIRIQDAEVTVQVQGSKRVTDIDEWRLVRSTLLGFGFERASGPVAISPPGFIDDVRAGFFDLASVPLDQTSSIAGAAIDRAALDDPATIGSIEISRQTFILPDPHFGNVRWQISLGTGRESATVNARADGIIASADLSQTNRARMLDLIGTDDWPKEAAIADLVAVLGEGKIIHDLRIYGQYINVVSTHPTAQDKTRDVSWSLSGVTSMGILTPRFPDRGDETLFSLRDVKLGSLAAVRASVRGAWGNDKARITDIMLKRDMRSAGEPELRWIVSLNEMNGESGSMALSIDGAVRELTLPPSRRPTLDWLAPDTVVGTVARIGKEFSSDTRLSEVMFQNDKVRILAEDPRAPGTNADFIMDAQKIARSGTPMPWDVELRKEQTFQIADLAFFDAAKLRELLDRTYRRLGTDPIKMPLSRYTFSVGQLKTPDGSFMVPSLDGKVTLEIRVEAANRMDGGWVTYSSRGEEIDVMTP